MLTESCTTVTPLPALPEITHHRHRRGWLETPEGRRVQPNPQAVQFIHGLSSPVIRHPRRRWFSRVMGIFA